MVEPTPPSTPPSTPRERFNISQLAIQYSWLTLGFWIAVAVAGAFAFSTLKYALFPDITFPVVVVNAAAPLPTALESEAQLTRPIETQLQGLDRLKRTDSLTYPGRAVVSLSFAVGTDLATAQQAVESRLQDLELPGAKPEVLPINLNEAAVISYAIQSKTAPLAEVSSLTQAKIIPKITQIPDVLKVTLLGAPLKVPAAKALPSKSSPDVPAKELAKELAREAPTIVRFNGAEAVAIQVVKQGTANTLQVVQQVEAAVSQLRQALPELEIQIAATQANYIRAATGETIQALIEAIVLSILVIFPFLGNWRATLISALAIPLSLLGTFIVMAIYGFNLETLTLLALALVIGNIVDDAIVDVENISRHLEQGESPRQAAITATNEIGLTVTAATLTAVAVFLPVGLMGGVLGQFFKPFGITIAASMITSLLVARTLSPLLAVYWLRPTKATSRAAGWTERINQTYRQLLDWSLRHRGWVVGIACFSCVAGLALIPLIPKGFIPKLDRGEFNITYTAPLPQAPAASPNALARTTQINPQLNPSQNPLQNPLQNSLKVAEQLDDYLRQSPQVENLFTVVGTRQGEPNKGSIYIQLKSDRTLPTAQVQDQFRRDLPVPAGVSTSIEDIQFVDTGGEQPVQIKIVGEDLAALGQAAEALKARLEKIPGFEDVTATAEVGQGGQIAQINRSNGQRLAVVSANLGHDLTLGEATDQAVAEAKAVLPAGLSLDLGGDSARVGEVLGSFGGTLALSLLCIVLVLLWLFRSWVDTVVIFMALPLSTVGAMIGLLITQSDFGMISLIGIIFLFGLTNKNAILIVDYIKQLRRSGLSRREAILEAVPIRLRPILMTTAATILGMLPIALGFGAGAELRAPMAVAIMGGLVTSTLLSLLVVPVIYDLLDEWRMRHSR